jgi:hypothetical protein
MKRVILTVMLSVGLCTVAPRIGESAVPSPMTARVLDTIWADMPAAQEVRGGRGGRVGGGRGGGGRAYAGHRGGRGTVHRGAGGRGHVAHRGGAYVGRGGAAGVRGGAAGVRGGAVGVRGGAVGVRGGAVGVRGGAVGVRGAAVGVRGARAWTVRPWVRRAYYGTAIAGVAVGTIIAVNSAGVAPVAASDQFCWYWTDNTQTQGYWDYCNPPAQ